MTAQIKAAMERRQAHKGISYLQGAEDACLLADAFIAEHAPPLVEPTPRCPYCSGSGLCGGKSCVCQDKFFGQPFNREAYS